MFKEHLESLMEGLGVLNHKAYQNEDPHKLYLLGRDIRANTKSVCVLQSTIDRLMLKYCSKDMTAKQLEELETNKIWDAEIVKANRLSNLVDDIVNNSVSVEEMKK